MSASLRIATWVGAIGLGACTGFLREESVATNIGRDAGLMLDASIRGNDSSVAEETDASANTGDDASTRRDASMTTGTDASVGRGSDLYANGHRLYKQDGTAFLWVGDTAWFMGHSSFEKAKVYLDHRATKGFTVIQMGCIGWGDDPNEANDDGVTPFVAGATDVSADTNAEYWENIGSIVDYAGSHGIHVALLPFNASDQVNEAIWLGDTNTTVAYEYGYFLGSTFNQSNVLWVLGGDAVVSYEPLHGRTRVLASGIADGNAGLSRSPTRSDTSRNYGTTLMTFHPRGSESSSMIYNEDVWLDFNMIQTWNYSDLVYPMVSSDYRLGKPVVLGEGQYESNGPNGTDIAVRGDAYHAFTAGAAGYTFGNVGPNHDGSPCCNSDVQINLDSPGTTSIAFYRSFLSSFDWYNYVPAPDLIESGDATAAKKDNTGAIVYLVGSGSVGIQMDQLDGGDGNVHVVRFDPAGGTSATVGDFPASGVRHFDSGGLRDAVLQMTSGGG